jgi:hypothetical protein
MYHIVFFIGLLPKEGFFDSTHLSIPPAREGTFNHLFLAGKSGWRPPLLSEDHWEIT